MQNYVWFIILKMEEGHFFFKAVDDEQHIDKCDYKIENYKESSIKVNENGIFTEGQINASVRSLYNDYTQPLIQKGGEKKKEKNL